MSGNDDKPKILLIGGGGHCRSMIDVLEHESRFEIAGIVDLPEQLGKEVLGYRVIATDEQLAELKQDYDYALVTLGQIKTSKPRQILYHQLKQLGYHLPTIISPLAYISKHAQIGEGSVIMHQALVNANAKIGNNCIINTKSLIEHDVIIHDHCHISTAAIINGGVVVKENTFIGSNSVSVEMTKLAGFIKAGSLAR